MADQTLRSDTDPRQLSRRESKGERRRQRSSSRDDKRERRERRRSRSRDRDAKRRDSKRDSKPKLEEYQRGLNSILKDGDGDGAGSGDRGASNLDSHVQNQFPGEFPSTFARPYRPPGLATEYYGDQGESVADQPGVRPQRPSIIHSADQAHLQGPSAEPAPPPEPSSLGQLGAAASFFTNTGDAEDETSTPIGNLPKPNIDPSKFSSTGASPRTSPGPGGRPTSFLASASVASVAAMSAGGGLAGEYYNASFTPTLGQGGFYTSPTSNTHEDIHTPVANVGSSRPLRPSSQHSDTNSALYAAATGIAAGAGNNYFAQQHAGQASQVGQGQQHLSNSQNAPMRTEHRHRRRGPLDKLVNFFKDPEGVAQFEDYSQTVGICKYCFDPRSSPKDAPRKHNPSRRYSGGRYGSNTRVDKTYRQHSSDDEKRTKSSSKKPWVAGGLAGYGLAKLGENVLNSKGFDDTYSVRTGNPVESQQSLGKNERQYSRREKFTKQEGVSLHHTSSHQRERRTQSSRNSSSTSSSDSQPAMPNGAVLGAAVGAAVIASDQKDKGSRKRSQSPKKRYYHKRVSPGHSYVDLSKTVSGGAGIGSFFSSPSANRLKGKRSKGLFAFGNASSSSSDADLAFGEGSVKRKNSKRDARRKTDDRDVNSAILGLAATGVTLAAASSRKESKKRQITDSVPVKNLRKSASWVREQRRSHNANSSSSTEENSGWEDASDHESSDHSALAYGSRLSARRSRDSLGSSDGTSKWDWRWNRGKRDKPKKGRVDSDDISRMPHEARVTGAALGTPTLPYSQTGFVESSARLPTLQYVHPMPTADPGVFDVARQSSTAISPIPSFPPSVTSYTIPLHHPQPFTPVSAAMYTTSAPSSAPIASFSGPNVPISQPQRNFIIDDSTSRPESWYNENTTGRHRSDSSPARYTVSRESAQENARRRASTKDHSSSVQFDLTEEQAERERRSHDRSQRRSGRHRDKDQETRLIEETDKVGDIKTNSETKIDPDNESAERRRVRERQIEEELERLYAEDRRQRPEAKVPPSDSTMPITKVAAITAGAVAAATVATTVTRDVENGIEKGSRGRLTLDESERSPSDGVATGEMDESDRQRRRTAQKAAIRIRTSPNPASHDDHAVYFTPPELQGKLREHNDAAIRRHTPEPNTPLSPEVIEIVPKGGSSPCSPSLQHSAGSKFDPYHYTPFGIRSRDDPSAHPWRVPHLDLIEPTPPHSTHGSVRGTASPIPPASPEPIQKPESKPQRSRSEARVSWGEPETREFDIVTPLNDPAEFVGKKREKRQPDEEQDQGTRPIILEIKPRETKPVDDDHTSTRDPPGFSQDLEFAAALAAGAQEAGFNPSIVIDDPTYHRRESPPGSESKGIYQSPFAETVSDLGTFYDHPIPARVGFIKGELPRTPKPKEDEDQVERGTDADIDPPLTSKVSKKERRRIGKAETARGSEDSSLSASGPDPAETTTRATDLRDVVKMDEKEPKVPGRFNVFDYIDEQVTPNGNGIMETSRSEGARENTFLSQPLLVLQSQASRG